MKFQNRFIRLAAALAIVGIVATQIPSRTSVAFAQDGYPEKSDGLFTLKGTGGLLLGAVVVAAAAYAILPKRADEKESQGSGNSGGVALSKSVYDTLDSMPNDFSIIANLIRASEQTDNLREEGPFTILAPTNDALTKALGTDGVAELQTPAKQKEAKELLQSITIKGSFNVAALKEAANSGTALETMSGQSIVLKLSGDKLVANGIEVLSNESVAVNGWVIALDGVIAPAP